MVEERKKHGALHADFTIPEAARMSLQIQDKHHPFFYHPLLSTLK